MRGGYELGLGAFKCVYEDASVDEDVFNAGLTTGRAAVGDVDVGLEVTDELALKDGFETCRGDSESDALSQASSSAHSAVEYDENRLEGCNPM